MLTRPAPGEYAPYFENYLQHVHEATLIEALEAQIDELGETLAELDEAAASRIDPPYTWTIKQVVGHLIDTELVFSYRARRIASGDDTPLVGFDHAGIVEGADYETVTLPALLDEFADYRRGFVAFCRRLTPEMVVRQGVADGHPLSVRAAAAIQLGHVRHHLAIFKKRLSPP